MVTLFPEKNPPEDEEEEAFCPPALDVPCVDEKR
jgi:hypothetical protein